jgi:hypothetical protein
MTTSWTPVDEEVASGSAFVILISDLQPAL